VEKNRFNDNHGWVIPEINIADTSETFSKDDSEESELMAERRRKPKTTHYETLHGAEAVRALRAQHQASFEKLVSHLTGAVKAKIIGEISRQAARQLKAKVPAGQLQFTIPPHLQNMVQEEIGKIHEEAKQQAKTELANLRKGKQ
jgi:hypothetical protein